jgi:hypothetical protein
MSKSHMGKFVELKTSNIIKESTLMNQRKKTSMLSQVMSYERNKSSTAMTSYMNLSKLPPGVRPSLIS